MGKCRSRGLRSWQFHSSEKKVPRIVINISNCSLLVNDTQEKVKQPPSFREVVPGKGLHIGSSIGLVTTTK